MRDAGESEADEVVPDGAGIRAGGYVILVILWAAVPGLEGRVLEDGGAGVGMRTGGDGDVLRLVSVLSAARRGSRGEEEQGAAGEGRRECRGMKESALPTEERSFQEERR
jgi:hypothetical protein